ncbi:MAG: D-alanine--D-alanine ligase [Actinobacteria bacterium]|uniref:Unannotated protein n=1 Tax=freshwater metagenome TaxID=449393 RepID=A0A6J7SNM5_9ZZZZ|nr:D-alanine--D-alanine ligase [Actinomycetota bacterium]MTB28688.1 D-alanine--D-alanine ligase [Actinomycetota bacterium]
MKKIRVAVLFGGQSSEHSVSCVSASGVMRALDPEKYEVLALGISQRGHWREMDSHSAFSMASSALACVPDDGAAAAFSPDPAVLRSQFGEIDVVFPVLHGPWGEDGTIQGLLELAGIPYVGSGVLASAVGMDKVTMKVLLAHSGLNVGRFLSISDRQWRSEKAECIEAVNNLGYPVFVKPARAGSSRGISKVHGEGELVAAIEQAREHDPRVIVEASVQQSRELECGVLSSEFGTLISSRIAEIIVGGQHEFYDFEAKYLEDSAELIVPADLPMGVELELQALAIRAFEALGCEGLARVDFFLDSSGNIIVNEVNTMPGFTPISMYPRMWQASGIEYGELIDTLINDAIRRGTGLR